MGSSSELSARSAFLRFVSVLVFQPSTLFLIGYDSGMFAEARLTFEPKFFPFTFENGAKAGREALDGLYPPWLEGLTGFISLPTAD